MTDYSSYFFQNIINHLPQYIFWKDRESRFLGCNMKFAQLLGLNSPQDIVGKNDYDLPWSKVESDKFVQDDKAVIESGKAKLFYEENQHQADGKEHVVQVSKIPLFDNHKIIGIICIYEDITDRKQAEQLKIEHQKSLEKAEYLKSIAGSIAHDLRTPLASIRLSMQGIGKISEKFAEDHELAVAHDLTDPIRPNKLHAFKTALERAQREIDFANHYIDLNLGNLKTDQINSDGFNYYNINQIIDECLANYPYRHLEQRSLIHWNSDNDFNFWGDTCYMKTVLNNLLKNAFYFIDKHRRGEIYIWAENLEHENRLHIKDTAIGASQEIVNKMFDGFYSNRESGTGLGLALCKSVMHSFKGDIWAQSQLNEYMHLTLFFPKINK